MNFRHWFDFRVFDLLARLASLVTVYYAHPCGNSTQSNWWTYPEHLTDVNTRAGVVNVTHAGRGIFTVQNYLLSTLLLERYRRMLSFHLKTTFTRSNVNKIIYLQLWWDILGTCDHHISLVSTVKENRVWNVFMTSTNLASDVPHLFLTGNWEISPTPNNHAAEWFQTCDIVDNGDASCANILNSQKWLNTVAIRLCRWKDPLQNCENSDIVLAVFELSHPVKHSCMWGLTRSRSLWLLLSMTLDAHSCTWTSVSNIVLSVAMFVRSNLSGIRNWTRDLIVVCAAPTATVGCGPSYDVHLWTYTTLSSTILLVTNLWNLNFLLNPKNKCLVFFRHDKSV